MTATTILKRIDNIESKLTPKEWAVRLADEIRKYPSENEYFYSFLNYASAKDTPFGKPFFMLDKQAEEQHPGHRPEDIREQHRIARKLRGEYQALKTLMNQTNEKIKHKAEIWKLKSSLQMSILNGLLLKDKLVKAEMEIGGNGLAEETYDFGFPSIFRDWRPRTMILIMQFVLYDAIVKTIQEKYFEGHPFIFRDVEEKLSETRMKIEGAVVTFNEYLAKMGSNIKTIEDEKGAKDKTEWLRQHTLNIDEIKSELEQKSIVEIAEKWAKDAMDKTILEILDNLGKYEEADNFLMNLAMEEIKDLKEINQEEEFIRIVSE